MTSTLLDMELQTGEHLRQATARALLRGEPAEGLAARGQITLAPSYIVLLPDIANDQRLPPLSGQDGRSGVLTIVDDDQPVILVPCLTAVQRNEISVLCERTMGTMTSKKVPVAAAVAQTRVQIGLAVYEAQTVMNVIRTLRYPARVYQLFDVPLEASLIRSPDLADLLALRLVPLRGSGAPLLETLQAYLESGQDRRKAARMLHVHPNTLDYRLRRIRDLTGLSPTAALDIQMLGAAITAWRLAQRDPA